MVNSELIPSAKHDAKDLVGTRTLVSVVTERDGRKFDTYGPNAKGTYQPLARRPRGWSITCCASELWPALMEKVPK